ncbi:UNVERIFIED_CONTAM: hypothetical protein K2H54_045673 [Gekko kuhli]
MHFARHLGHLLQVISVQYHDLFSFNIILSISVLKNDLSKRTPFHLYLDFNCSVEDREVVPILVLLSLSWLYKGLMMLQWNKHLLLPCSVILIWKAHIVVIFQIFFFFVTVHFTLDLLLEYWNLRERESYNFGTNNTYQEEYCPLLKGVLFLHFLFLTERFI